MDTITGGVRGEHYGGIAAVVSSNEALFWWLRWRWNELDDHQERNLSILSFRNINW